MNQLKLKTASIQGKQASFSHQAAESLYQVAEFLYRDSFTEVFEDLVSDRADVIIVPIENSTYGSVYENYDKLTEHHCQIVAETYVKVSLHLLGLPSADLSALKQVYSHQVALNQIQNFRNEHRHLKFVPQADTAGAAETVKSLNDPTIAACASRSAAQLHKLEVLAEEIEDNQKNFTRFFAITRHLDKLFVPRANKTTVQFELGSESGSLYKTLRSFADRDLALSRIESRPIINTDWNYRFYLDILASYQQPKLRHALTEIKDYVKSAQVEVLGSYKSTDLPVNSTE